jgi:uncharacterized membrane protein YdjX (TVP38/TMEM64 family)
MERPANQGNRRSWTRAGITLLAVLALFVALRMLPVRELLEPFLAWVAGLGPWGGVLVVLAYVVVSVLLLPASILTLGAGFIFGVLKGTVLVWFGATLGATAAFLVGRYLARDWVARKLGGNPKFRAIDEAVAREGWKIVGLTRLSPVFPFNLLNYAFGVTKVSLRGYVLASSVGMLPGTLMYVYFGSLAGSLAGVGTEDRSRSAAEWLFYGLGLLATLAVTLYVTRLARNALKGRVP